MNKVADYDTYDYDYSTYWDKREYEHKSEVLVLEKLLKNEKGKWFLDIGGSFGRLASIYSKKFTHPVIIDYSLKTLQKNFNQLKKDYPNIELVAANVYSLPFRDNTFDGSIMVRVLHHIEKQNECIKEIYRVLDRNAIYIQEYANKVHIKAFLRAIFTLNFSFFNQSPYQQPDKHNYEGAKEGSEVLFLNYHPYWIKKLFSKIGLHIEKKYGCSFLRVDILKRKFNTKTLLFFENIFQNTLSWSNISPSIFVKARALKKKTSAIEVDKLTEILICPKCKGDLNIQNDSAQCKKCESTYIKKENIWDFRV